jgi:UDP-2,3-diacylglucosamine pyrophosphatase LpxH
MLNHIRDEADPHFVFWTGDNSAHNIWANSKEEVIDANLKVTSVIKDAFKDSGIKVYPSLGNHDFWMVNQESFLTPENEYIQTYAEEWREFIGEDAYQ